MAFGVSRIDLDVLAVCVLMLDQVLLISVLLCHRSGCVNG